MNDRTGRRPDSGLHARLRRETGTDHQRLENRLDLLDEGLERRRYERVLLAFYGFYEPAERCLRTAPAPSVARGFCLPDRTPLLVSDLLAIGASQTELENAPRCAALPACGQLEQMAGCLYVLEGASLGGQIIARALRRNLGLGRRGLRFFTGEGTATGVRWKRVLRWLDEIVSAGGDPDAVVASARETFIAFEAWLAAEGAVK